jgi:hypothetical protein
MDQMPQAHEPVCDSHDVRCQCGRLVARVTLRGIEIKCARCKRLITIGWSELKLGVLSGLVP